MFQLRILMEDNSTIVCGPFETAELAVAFQFSIDSDCFRTIILEKTT